MKYHMRQHYYKPILRNIISQSLEMLECCPLKVLWSDRTLSIGKRKIKDIRTKFKNIVSVMLSEPQLTEQSKKQGSFAMSVNMQPLQTTIEKD